MYVCLFDIDGTLIDGAGAGSAAMYAAVEEAFGVRLQRGLVPFRGRTDRGIVADLFRLAGVEDNQQNWELFLRAYEKILPEKLRLHRGRVLPGVHELLEKLARSPRIILGLLTGNVQVGAYIKLAHFGLNGYFRFGVFGDNHYERTPLGAIARLEVHKLTGGGVDPQDIWVIGDTPLDVRCAKSAQLRSVAVATGGHSVEELAAEGPDIVCPDLTQCYELLKALGLNESA